MNNNTKQLLPHVREQRIATLEASMRRLDEVDPEEVDSDEYAAILRELVRLREDRDRAADTHKETP